MGRLPCPNLMFFLGVIVFGVGMLSYYLLLPTMVEQRMGLQVAEQDQLSAAGATASRFAGSVPETINNTVQTLLHQHMAESRIWVEDRQPETALFEAVEADAPAAVTARLTSLAGDPCMVSVPTVNMTLSGFHATVVAQQPATVSCATGSSETRIYQPLNRSQPIPGKAQLQLVSVARNVTQDPGFRALVEAVAANTTNYLQLETAHGVNDSANCDIDQDAVHREGYGYTGNLNGSAPFNDGPDCMTDQALFDVDRAAFRDLVDAAENKYEQRMGEQIQNLLNARYGVEGSLQFDVVELEYNIHNIRKQYLDRKVIACAESHREPFHVATCSARQSVDCPNCTTCNTTVWETDNPAIDLSCTATTCNATTVSPNKSCDGVTGCSCPSYFPLNTDPAASVNDSTVELEHITTIDIAGDCPGATTVDGYQNSTCELDNACTVDQEGYRASGTVVSGDEQVLPDEEGTFRICANTDTLYGDNPWYVTTTSQYTDPYQGPGEPDWRAKRSLLRGRYLRDYDLTDAAGRVAQQLPLRTRTAATSMQTPQDCAVNGTCNTTATASCSVAATETSYIDTAFEDEVVQTTGEYRFDLNAYVRVRITVTDNTTQIPTTNGFEPARFVTFYDQYAYGSFQDTQDSPEQCIPSSPIDPDTASLQE